MLPYANCQRLCPDLIDYACLTPNEISPTVKSPILPLLFHSRHFLRFLGLVPLKVSCLLKRVELLENICPEKESCAPVSVNGGI